MWLAIAEALGRSSRQQEVQGMLAAVQIRHLLEGCQTQAGHSVEILASQEGLLDSRPTLLLGLGTTVSLLRRGAES